MMGWIAAGVVAAGAATIVTIQYMALRGQYTPLSRRQPDRAAADAKTPLGMEATDLGLVARTNRRNESLERGHTSWTRPRSGTGKAAMGAETYLPALPDDETYAQRFYTAFIKNKPKDTDP